MSAYIKVSTFEYPRHIGDIQIDPAGMADYSLVEQTNMPEYDPKLQRCIESNPVNHNGVWKQVWVVRNVTDQEIEINNKLLLRNKDK